MKNIIFIIIFFSIGCSLQNKKTRFNKLKTTLENSAWEKQNVFPNSNNTKQFYFTLKDFRLVENRLVCTQEFNGDSRDYIIIYFKYSKTKLLRCSSKTSICGKIRIKNGILEHYVKNEQGKITIHYYRKILPAKGVH